MISLSVAQTRSTLHRLVDDAARSQEPIRIKVKRSNVILLSEQDRHSIQETLFLLSIPGMCESIRKGIAEPLEKASKKSGWRIG